MDYEDMNEIIRCKECKFWDVGLYDTCYGRCKMMTEYHQAERPSPNEYFFCAYAERK